MFGSSNALVGQHFLHLKQSRKATRMNLKAMWFFTEIIPRKANDIIYVRFVKLMDTHPL